MRTAFHSVALALVGLGTMLFAGCPGPEEPGPGERSVELGTGTWRFEALEDGQEVDLVRGAQGGWHVWVSLRATAVESDRGVMTLTLQPADESRAPQVSTVLVAFDPQDSQGRRSFLGWQGALNDPSCQVGELLRIEARFQSDDGGQELVAERMIVPMGGAYPPATCER